MTSHTHSGPADRAPVVHVETLDHVVLNVADVERSLRFYCGVLGLVSERLEPWRAGQAPFPSLRVDASTVIDLLAAPRTGENADHICLVVSPTDFQRLRQSGALDVAEGPVTRWGARGNGTSLYVRDPDGNLIELRYYS